MHPPRHLVTFFALALVCLAGVGCASGPNVWREVTTPHFVLRTDLDAETARRAAAELELNRDMLVSAAWPKMEIPEWARAEVYVLERDEFKQVFGPTTDSVSIGGVPQRFFMYGDPDRWETRSSLAVSPVSTLRFQLAVRMAALVYPDGPPWFARGIGHFLETVHPSEDGQSVVMGAVNVSELRNYRQHRTVSLRDLLGWRPAEETNWGIEGLSWIFAHWLINTQGDRFSRYRAELMQGRSGEAAFAAAFPGLDQDATDRELFLYSKHGQYTELSAPLRRTQGKFDERTLSPADMQVLRVQLDHASWAMNPKLQPADHEQCRERIGMALVLDPTNLAALLEDDWSPLPQRLSRARSAAAAHPDDARAWELLGRLLNESQPGTTEQENAYRKAISLSPKSPDTLNNLAWLLLQQGRVSDALPFTMRAMKVSQHPNVIDTYAAVMFRLGNCNTAIAAQQRAVERLTPARRTEDPGFEKRLSEYQANCPKRRPPR